MELPNIRKKLREMVEEDVGGKDITTAFTPDRKSRAEIIAKEPSVVAGIEEIQTLFSLFNVTALTPLRDGEKVEEGQTVLELKGSSHNILVVERTALNILSRMSGIASLTRGVLVEARKGNPHMRLAATRKTTPLFGRFEKKAVSLGGGETHRIGLWDMVLIKDNHLKLLGSISLALETAKEETPDDTQIEIEVPSPQGALEAARAGADIVLLDNFTPKKIKEAIVLLEKNGLRKDIVLEASGGITKKNVREYAKTGVDLLSLGMLTHSAKAKDFSLKLL